MREIRTLRSMWRGLETGPQGYRASPRPYPLFTGGVFCRMKEKYTPKICYF